MELLLKRSQKDGSILAGGKVVFVLDAKARLSDFERGCIKRYQLGEQLIYSSEAAQKHAAAAQSWRSGLDYSNNDVGSKVLGGITNAAFNSIMNLGHAAIARMSLNIRVKDLEVGVRHECKTLDEAIAAENGIYEACQHLQTYLSTASTYNGEEQVIPITING